MSFNPIRFHEENIGATIKGSKRKFIWTFEMDGRSNTIVLECSMITHKRKLTFNGEIKFHGFKKIGSRFTFQWQLGQHIIAVENRSGKAEVIIDNMPFMRLYYTKQYGDQQAPGSMPRAQHSRATHEQDLSEVRIPKELQECKEGEAAVDNLYSDWPEAPKPARFIGSAQNDAVSSLQDKGVITSATVIKSDFLDWDDELKLTETNKVEAPPANDMESMDIFSQPAPNAPAANTIPFDLFDDPGNIVPATMVQATPATPIVPATMVSAQPAAPIVPSSLVSAQPATPIVPATMVAAQPAAPLAATVDATDPFALLGMPTAPLQQPLAQPAAPAQASADFDIFSIPQNTSVQPAQMIPAQPGQSSQFDDLFSVPASSLTPSNPFFTQNQDQNSIN